MPETILFYLFSGLAIVMSVLVIGQRNPMYSIITLIVSFGALSGLYIQLDAPFVAITQAVVYTGAKKTPPNAADAVRGSISDTAVTLADAAFFIASTIGR